MRILIQFPLALSFALAPTSAQSTASLDAISTSIAQQNYRAASRALMPLVSELMSQHRGEKLPAIPPRGELEKSDAALLQEVASLRNLLQKKETRDALRAAYFLGLSLTLRDQGLSPDTRNRQEQLATPLNATGRTGLLNSCRRMQSAYQAGELDEASRLARLVLEQHPGQPETANFVHQAHTILGLVAWDRGQPPQAIEHLQHSVTQLKLDKSISIGQPSFALAERLLASGSRTAVLDYLTACSTLGAWTSAQAKLTRFTTAIQSGHRTTFGPDAVLLF